MSDSVLLTVLSTSESETDLLGRQLAIVLPAGLTVALNGQLGSGKTRFVRSLCQGLGVSPSEVTSPTFVLMQLYTSGRIPVAHFDTYRLGDVDEFLAIGAEEYLHSEDWVCLVEWADRVAELLPVDRLTIDVSHQSETGRVFEFRCSGPKSAWVLQGLQATRTVG